MIAIERRNELDLTGRDEYEIAALLEAAFGVEAGFEGTTFNQQRHHLRLLARDEGRLVGHVALLYRAIRLGDRLVDITGLAEVATAPDRRGEGIASALLRAAIEESRRSRAAFLLLFGTAGLYAAQGFRPARNHMRDVVMPLHRTLTVRNGPARDLLVLPLRSEDWDDTPPVDLLGPVF